MKRNIPKSKKSQLIKAIFWLVLLGISLYWKKVIDDDFVNKTCNDHLSVATAFIEARQSGSFNEAEILEYLYKKRYYSESEKKRVKTYMDLAYSYPVAITTEERNSLIKKYRHEVYDLCIAKRTDIASEKEGFF
ncbi:hypothetical protein [Acinetobacter nectaris]|uniref:hypothetical protein n=1 Tax=Acinetobacter nectaris TaxID=1219382 RepID=UPI001F3D1537|nr:hypothetical protein [Acinetobacter nectaris]MCF9045987.1 hypothetical protein [Acinetobacter nectaris]